MQVEDNYTVHSNSSIIEIRTSTVDLGFWLYL